MDTHVTTRDVENLVYTPRETADDLGSARLAELPFGPLAAGAFVKV
jgi:hypothetical protein